MRIRLFRKWRSYPVGQIVNVFRPEALKLIEDKKAEEYKGPYPPKEKMRTQLFKLK